MYVPNFYAIEHKRKPYLNTCAIHTERTTAARRNNRQSEKSPSQAANLGPVLRRTTAGVAFPRPVHTRDLNKHIRLHQTPSIVAGANQKTAGTFSGERIIYVQRNQNQRASNRSEPKHEKENLYLKTQDKLER